MSNARVLIGEESLSYHSQIRVAVKSSPEFEVAGFAANGKLAIDRLRAEDRDDMTLITLELGATNFMTKPTAEAGGVCGTLLIVQQLLPMMRHLEVIKANISPQLLPTKNTTKKSWRQFNPPVVVTASSTGGPSALEVLFRQLTHALKVPVIIFQHMSPVFTTAMVERLARISGQDVREGCLGIVLAGMGEDGARGAQEIKNSGGVVAIQDQKTSVVFGMLGTTYELDAYDHMNSIDELALNLCELISVKGNA